MFRGEKPLHFRLLQQRRQDRAATAFEQPAASFEKVEWCRIGSLTQMPTNQRNSRSNFQPLSFGFKAGLKHRVSLVICLAMDVP
jgi:hypothetical protein